MRASRMFIPTLREDPAEAEAVSHRLMLKAGLIRRLASGVYSYLPLGLRTFKKIEGIIREEMDRAGAQELLMPALLPAESFRESGRWEVFGPEIFRLKDSGGRDFCLGPTHEEIFAAAVRNETRSYRSLPLILYQIQTKYRDELRPRYGVIRAREFVMKDAYSFDRDGAGLDRSYAAMSEAYARFLQRCGLKFTVADADSGAMGGSGSQEFVVESDIGESVIAGCRGCGYAANIEKAECGAEGGPAAPGAGAAALPGAEPGTKAGMLPLEKVPTPGARTIEELEAFFGCSAREFAKTLIYRADGGRLVAAVIRGDRELNETKLKNLLRCSTLEMAGAGEVKAATGAEVGFAGPVGIKAEIVLDLEILSMKNYITGANATGFHLKNVNTGRDFTPKLTGDLRLIAEGDPCPRCGGPVTLSRGIEVGHIFKLGTKYSAALGCNYLDADGKEKPMVMGSYGIGISRVMASIVEQNNDDDGIIWPVSVAPFQVIVVPVNYNDSLQAEMAEKLYKSLQSEGIEVLLDDRDERAGVKFKDADLLGIPIRITVGKKCGRGLVEYKIRNSGTVRELDAAEAVREIRSAIKVWEII